MNTDFLELKYQIMSLFDEELFLSLKEVAKGIFEEIWMPLNGKYQTLKTFIRGFKTCFAFNTTLESDFSILTI